jgi:peptidoglycan/LPS O-acetylase OafA/YrhL
VKISKHPIHQFLINSLEDTKPKNSIAALDGVRAIACLIVLTFHLGLITRDTHLWSPTNPNPLATSIILSGASGVTLFFVLSGFLLFLPYAKAILFDASWPSTRSFYLRRAFRIIPGYYSALFLLILFTQPQYLHPDHVKNLTLFLLFFMDSTRGTFHQINGPFWTLAVEWQYYLLLPFLASGIGFIARHGSLRRRLWTVMLCLAGVIAWGLFSRCWGLYLTAHPTQTYLVPRSTMDVVLFFTYGTTGKYLEDFAVGMLISVCYVLSQHVSGSKYAAYMRRLSPWLWGSGILLLVFMAMWHMNQWYFHSWPFLDGIFPFYDSLSEIALSLGFGLCVTAILFGPTALKRPFEWSPLRWLGLISYSLYMWHLPLLIVFMVHAGYQVPAWNPFLVYCLYWLWIVLVIIPFTYLSYIWIEKPWMKLGNTLLGRERKLSP